MNPFGLREVTKKKKGDGIMDINRLYSMMQQNRLDGLALFSPENVLYSCGCEIETQRLLRTRLASTVFIPGKDPALVLCNIELALAEEYSRIRDVVTYIEFAESPIAKVVDTIKRKGVQKGRIGVDLAYLPAQFYKEFQADAPDFEIVDSSELMVEMRCIKTAAEVEHQEKISKITVKVIEDAFAATKIGDTDTDIHRRIVTGIFENKGKLNHAIVAVAQRGSNPHSRVGDQKLKSGDVVRVDVGGIWKGYMSDVARTVVVGEPSKLQASCFNKLARIEKNVIDSIKPGVRASTLFNQCKEGCEREGVDFWFPHIGHGMGLEVHEYPMIHPANHDEIREGMVLNIEPLVVDGEKSGYHIEDLSVVTSDGVRVLTGSTFPTEIPRIG